MLYNVNVSSTLLTCPLGGSPTATVTGNVPVYGDMLLRVIAWAPADDVFYRILNNGKPLAPESGFINLPTYVPIVLDIEKQIEGPPFVITVEGYTTNVAARNLRVTILTGTVKEKDLGLDTIRELSQIRKLLELMALGKPPTIPPQKEK